MTTHNKSFGVSESELKQEKEFCIQVESVSKSAKNEPPPPPASSGDGSEITVHEFLDFLKTAYQVQENLENTLLAEGLTEAVDWLKLRDTTLVKKCETGMQTSDTKLAVERKPNTLEIARRKSDSSINTHDTNDTLSNKLGKVLSEGLLDSVLPYLVPSASQSNCKRPPQPKLSEKASQGNLGNVSSNKDLGIKKKTSTDSTGSSKTVLIKPESEVEIHVCDEVKGAKKDFTCNQKLLVEKMGYFAEVTTGQRLEDMDISVHCDIGIFDWLMKWVKKDSLPDEEWPQLDAQCVIPVLVSAAFLKMDPLLEECLLYCHEHMNEILRTNTNLSCINDTVLTRLAAMYTNAEVESIRDRKDKIQSRLFGKLIKSLVEPVPESVRGHWNSLARVYRCGKCRQLVSPSVSSEIPCVPSCMRLLYDGSVVNNHVRDPHWDIKEYLAKLHRALKTWRKVYWRLWGDAHFLYCTTCKRYFPAHQIGWCRYHPDAPQFFTIDTQKAPLPVGRYPCCGERAYRYQLLDNHSGCKFREHTPNGIDVRDAAVLSMLETYRHLVEEEPPQLMFPERLTRLVAREPNQPKTGKLDCKETFWWHGLEIVGPRPKLGLLGVFFDNSLRKEQSAAEEPTAEASSEDENTSLSSSSSSSDGSEESNPPPATKVNKKSRGAKKKPGRLWQQNLSARSNQDAQRTHEEVAMKRIASVLCRRISAASGDKSVKLSHKTMTRHVTPAGGTWVRLEAEWKESNLLLQQAAKMKNIYAGKARSKPRFP